MWKCYMTEPKSYNAATWALKRGNWYKTLRNHNKYNDISFYITILLLFLSQR
ncbi:hypothetical protein MIDIC_110106 [Alphaproteobacteria bacterium]